MINFAHVTAQVDVYYLVHVYHIVSWIINTHYYTHARACRFLMLSFLCFHLLLSEVSCWDPLAFV